MNKLLAALVTSLPLLIAPPPAAALQSGTDYQNLSPAQRTDAKKGQIEVTEFFWYRCPHCFNLEPTFNTWAKKQPANVVIRRVPAILNDNWTTLARAYYALEAMGLDKKLHGDVFNAIHLGGMNLNTPDAFFDWAVTKGVERKKIAEAYSSFSVNSKVARAQQMTKDYKLNGVPAIAINGKYLTSAYLTGSEEKLFAVLDQLVELELKHAPSKK